MNCQLCGSELRPSDDPRGFCKGPCQKPPSRQDYDRLEAELSLARPPMGEPMSRVERQRDTRNTVTSHVTPLTGTTRADALRCPECSVTSWPEHKGDRHLLRCSNFGHNEWPGVLERPGTTPDKAVTKEPTPDTTPDTCRDCGREIPYSGHGPRAGFCSEACRKRARRKMKLDPPL